MFVLKQNDQHKFNKKLMEQFFNTYKFSSYENNNIYFIVAERCLSL